MRWFPAWSVLLWCGLATPLQGQSATLRIHERWRLGLSIGSATFAGGATGTRPESDTLRVFPSGTTMWGVGAVYGQESFRFGVSLRYGQPGLAVRGPESSGLLIIAPNANHLTLLTPGLSSHLLRLRGGAAQRPSLGLGLERWALVGSPARTTLGGQAGIALELALTKALVATLESELGFTPASPFRRQDLPAGFEPRGAWRRTLAGGVACRF
jgi:hypothetical protein